MFKSLILCIQEVRLQEKQNSQLQDSDDSDEWEPIVDGLTLPDVDKVKDYLMWPVTHDIGNWATAILQVCYTKLTVLFSFIRVLEDTSESEFESESEEEQEPSLDDGDAELEVKYHACWRDTSAPTHSIIHMLIVLWLQDVKLDVSEDEENDAMAFLIDTSTLKTRRSSSALVERYSGCASF